MSAVTIERTPLGIPTLPEIPATVVPAACENCEIDPPHWWLVTEPCGDRWAVCHDCKIGGEREWAARVARGKRLGVCRACNQMSVNLRWEPINE